MFEGLVLCPKRCNSAEATLCSYNAWSRLPDSGCAHFLKRWLDFGTLAALEVRHTAGVLFYEVQDGLS